MARQLVAYGFNGMSNLKKSPGYFLDDTKRATPQVVLNADVFDDGAVVLRGCYRKLINLPGAHSLWGESPNLCVATGAAGSPSLFRVEAVSARELCQVSGPDRARMDFAEVDGRVYAANGYWQGVYDLGQDLVHGWGLSLPLAPDITQVEGDLPPGIYKLCYTRFEALNRVGGNGPVAEISWVGGTAGIQLTDLPDDVLVWITQPNGAEFYLALVVAGKITTPYYTQPLPTFGVEPPPPLTSLAFAHGRVWGASGKKVCYSDEFMYENFRSGGYFPFLEDITLIAPVNEGLFISSFDNTWFLKGTVPAKMTLEDVGGGAIPGTLTWTMMEGGAYEPKQSRTLCPVWMSPQGAIIGKHNGHLIHITENRLKINAMSRGAGFRRLLQGVIQQTVISLYGSTKGDFDADLHDIFERGRIYIPAPLEHQVYGGVIIGGEGEYL